MAKNFTFNGITSTSKNLKCKDISHLSFAVKSYESIKIPGRTGNLIIDDGSYENKAVEARTRILRFGDEVSHGKNHSRDHFQQVLFDITNYNFSIK